MPPEFLITSTGKPGDFLGGALLTGFIGQWNRPQAVEGTMSIAGGDWTLNWQQDSPGALFAHSVVLRTTAGLPDYDRAGLLRTMGHFLLSMMPDEGLTEAFEGLAETYVYWLTRTQR